MVKETTTGLINPVGQRTKYVVVRVMLITAVGEADDAAALQESEAESPVDVGMIVILPYGMLLVFEVHFSHSIHSLGSSLAELNTTAVSG